MEALAQLRSSFSGDSSLCQVNMKLARTPRKCLTWARNGDRLTDRCGLACAKSWVRSPAPHRTGHGDIMPALGKLRQEDQEFTVTLGYEVGLGTTGATGDPAERRKEGVLR